jgi:G:T-mismatch repair DNA endonuclease (very short patch repair protein)
MKLARIVERNRKRPERLAAIDWRIVARRECDIGMYLQTGVGEWSRASVARSRLSAERASG